MYSYLSRVNKAIFQGCPKIHSQLWSPALSFYNHKLGAPICIWKCILTFPPAPQNITRRQAFLIHLGVSLALFLALVAIVVFLWYPGPLLTLEGGWEGMRIIAIVDLVLPPPAYLNIV